MYALIRHTISIAILVPTFGCDSQSHIRTVQLVVEESNTSPETGYLPVSMNNGELRVLPRYLPRGDMPGFFKTTSGVAHVFYPWNTTQTDMSEVQFLIFELNLSEVEAREPELGRRLDSEPRLFKPTVTQWKQWKQTGELPLPGFNQLPESEIDGDFYVDKRLY